MNTKKENLNDNLELLEYPLKSRYMPTSEKVAYALNEIIFDRIGATPTLINHLSEHYYNYPNVLQFAEFFCTYWTLSGARLFKYNAPINESALQEVKRQEKIIDEKFKQWQEIMDFKIVDDIFLKDR